MASNQHIDGLGLPAIFQLGLTSLTGVVSVLGNVLIVIAITRNKKLRTPTNLLVLNLGVADLLTGVLCIPLTASAIVGRHWIAGLTMCQLQGFMMFVLGAVSIHSITVTAINRYCRILRPNFYRKWITYKMTVIFLLLMWVMLFCAVVVAVVSDIAEISYRPLSSSCVLRFSQSSLGRAALSLTVVFGFLYPATTVAVCYFHVFRKIRHHNSQATALRRQKSNSFSIQNTGATFGNRRLQQRKMAREMKSKETVICNSVQQIEMENAEVITFKDKTNTSANIRKNEQEESFVETKIISAKRSQAFSLQTLNPGTSCFATTEEAKVSTETNCVSESHISQSHRALESEKQVDITSTLPQRPKVMKEVNEVTSQQTSGLGPNIEEIRITRVLFAVLIGFVSCWVPITLLGLVTYTSLVSRLPHFIRFLSVWFVYLNSSLNVFIYGIMSKPFRREFMNIVFCRR